MTLSVLYRPVCACLLALALVLSASAAAPRDFDPLAAGIEENISYPAVPQKHREKVSAAMHSLERTLRELGYKTTRVRSGEVVLVTIPCSSLFAPNSIELKTKASGVLSQLLPYIRRSDNYKVIVAVHADNTGDAEYSDRLTADRANTVDDYFYRALGEQDSGIIPYGLGGDEPLMPNHGIENRAMNRRVEIYFVPTRAFIDKAKNR